MIPSTILELWRSSRGATVEVLAILFDKARVEPTKPLRAGIQPREREDAFLVLVFALVLDAAELAGGVKLEMVTRVVVTIFTARRALSKKRHTTTPKPRPDVKSDSK
jgi:hypothetical protein